MGRAPCCDKTKVKRGPWSPQEDTTLKNFLETYGTGGNWISLPQKAGLNRCGKSCRLRWLNYLRPDIKHGNFTDEEDTIILTLYHNIGSRWSVIASSLPGRTDNDVKNYWNTKLKKKFFASPSMTSSSTSMTSNNMFHGRSYHGSSSNSADSCLDMVAAPSQQLPGPMEFPGNVELNACNNRGYACHSTSSASLENTASSSNDEYFGSMLMSLDQLLMSDFDFEEINQSFAFSNFELAG